MNLPIKNVGLFSLHSNATNQDIRRGKLRTDGSSNA